MRTTMVLGALLTAAPLISQTADPEIRDGKLEWFTLTETQEEAARKMGAPEMVAEFGTDYVSWQYHANGDRHDASHVLVFRRSTRKLVSVTRAYEPDRQVDEFFPAAETSVHRAPNAEHFRMRVRELAGGRLLMAMGSGQAGEPAGQLVLLDRQTLRDFYPWLDQALAARARAASAATSSTATKN